MKGSHCCADLSVGKNAYLCLCVCSRVLSNTHTPFTRQSSLLRCLIFASLVPRGKHSSESGCAPWHRHVAWIRARRSPPLGSRDPLDVRRLWDFTRSHWKEMDSGFGVFFFL